MKVMHRVGFALFPLLASPCFSATATMDLKQAASTGDKVVALTPAATVSGISSDNLGVKKIGNAMMFGYFDVLSASTVTRGNLFVLKANTNLSHQAEAIAPKNFNGRLTIDYCDGGEYEFTQQNLPDYGVCADDVNGCDVEYVVQSGTPSTPNWGSATYDPGSNFDAVEFWSNSNSTLTGNQTIYARIIVPGVTEQEYTDSIDYCYCNSDLSSCSSGTYN